MVTPGFSVKAGSKMGFLVGLATSRLFSIKWLFLSLLMVWPAPPTFASQYHGQGSPSGSYEPWNSPYSPNSTPLVLHVPDLAVAIIDGEQKRTSPYECTRYDPETFRYSPLESDSTVGKASPLPAMVAHIPTEQDLYLNNFNLREVAINFLGCFYFEELVAPFSEFAALAQENCLDVDRIRNALDALKNVIFRTPDMDISKLRRTLCLPVVQTGLETLAHALQFSEVGTVENNPVAWLAINLPSVIYNNHAIFTRLSDYSFMKPDVFYPQSKHDMLRKYVDYHSMQALALTAKPSVLRQVLLTQPSFYRQLPNLESLASQPYASKLASFVSGPLQSFAIEYDVKWFSAKQLLKELIDSRFDMASSAALTAYIVVTEYAMNASFLRIERNCAIVLNSSCNLEYVLRCIKSDLFFVRELAHERNWLIDQLLQRNSAPNWGLYFADRQSQENEPLEKGSIYNALLGLASVPLTRQMRVSYNIWLTGEFSGIPVFDAEGNFMLAPGSAAAGPQEIFAAVWDFIKPAQDKVFYSSFIDLTELRLIQLWLNAHKGGMLSYGLVSEYTLRMLCLILPKPTSGMTFELVEVRKKAVSKISSDIIPYLSPRVMTSANIDDLRANFVDIPGFLSKPVVEWSLMHGDGNFWHVLVPANEFSSRSGVERLTESCRNLIQHVRWSMGQMSRQNPTKFLESLYLALTDHMQKVYQHFNLLGMVLSSVQLDAMEGSAEIMAVLRWNPLFLNSFQLRCLYKTLHGKKFIENFGQRAFSHCLDQNGNSYQSRVPLLRNMIEELPGYYTAKCYNYFQFEKRRLLADCYIIFDPLRGVQQGSSLALASECGPRSAPLQWIDAAAANYQPIEGRCLPVNTKQLFGVLERAKAIETVEEANNRAVVLNTLYLVMVDFFQCLFQKHLIPNNASGRLLPFGSYRLGVHDPGADIDVLFVAPKCISRDMFFSEFPNSLNLSNQFPNFVLIKNALVPLIKTICNNIEVDLAFVSLQLDTIPSSLWDNSILAGLGMNDVCSVNGSRATDELLRLVPNVQTFRESLRCVKLWAKRRGIYGSALGYLGGMAWAILTARICQLHPTSSIVEIFVHFFEFYDRWSWPQPICLKQIEFHPLTLKVWCANNTHFMPVITPAYPAMCSTHTVTKSTKRRITDEFKRARKLANEVVSNLATWDELMQPYDFFSQFESFIFIETSSNDRETQQKWSRYVETRLQRFSTSLESSYDVAVACTESFDKPMPLPESILCDQKCAKPRHSSPSTDTDGASDSGSSLDCCPYHTTFFIGLLNDSPRTISPYNINASIIEFQSTFSMYNDRTPDKKIRVQHVSFEQLPDFCFKDGLRPQQLFNEFVEPVSHVGSSNVSTVSSPLQPNAKVDVSVVASRDGRASRESEPLEQNVVTVDCSEFEVDNVPSPVEASFVPINHVPSPACTTGETHIRSPSVDSPGTEKSFFEFSDAEIDSIRLQWVAQRDCPLNAAEALVARIHRHRYSPLLSHCYDFEDLLAHKEFGSVLKVAADYAVGIRDLKCSNMFLVELRKFLMTTSEPPRQVAIWVGHPVIVEALALSLSWFIDDEDELVELVLQKAPGVFFENLDFLNQGTIWEHVEAAHLTPFLAELGKNFDFRCCLEFWASARSSVILEVFGRKKLRQLLISDMPIECVQMAYNSNASFLLEFIQYLPDVLARKRFDFDPALLCKLAPDYARKKNQPLETDWLVAFFVFSLYNEEQIYKRLRGIADSLFEMVREHGPQNPELPELVKRKVDGQVSDLRQSLWQRLSVLRALSQLKPNGADFSELDRLVRIYQIPSLRPMRVLLRGFMMLENTLSVPEECKHIGVPIPSQHYDNMSESLYFMYMMSLLRMCMVEGNDNGPILLVSGLFAIPTEGYTPIFTFTSFYLPVASSCPLRFLQGSWFRQIFINLTHPDGCYEPCEAAVSTLVNAGNLDGIAKILGNIDMKKLTRSQRERMNSTFGLALSHRNLHLNGPDYFEADVTCASDVSVHQCILGRGRAVADRAIGLAERLHRCMGEYRALVKKSQKPSKMASSKMASFFSLHMHLRSELWALVENHFEFSDERLAAIESSVPLKEALRQYPLLLHNLIMKASTCSPKLQAFLTRNPQLIPALNSDFVIELVENIHHCPQAALLFDNYVHGSESIGYTAAEQLKLLSITDFAGMAAIMNNSASSLSRGLYADLFDLQAYADSDPRFLLEFTIKWLVLQELYFFQYNLLVQLHCAVNLKPVYGWLLEQERSLRGLLRQALAKISREPYIEVARKVTPLLSQSLSEGRPALKRLEHVKELSEPFFDLLEDDDFSECVASNFDTISDVLATLQVQDAPFWLSRLQLADSFDVDSAGHSLRLKIAHSQVWRLFAQLSPLDKPYLYAALALLLKIDIFDQAFNGKECSFSVDSPVPWTK